ncbi:MAG: NADH dehydrogenase ubiquinone Fe-S protein 4, partial [Rhizomicrobium sp.]
DTAEEAIAYADRNQIPYQLFEPHVPRQRPKSYADNFRFDRKVPWSH